MLKDRAADLRRHRADLQRQLNGVNAELDLIERHCDHDWGEAVSDLIVHPDHRVEAVEMGSDSTPAYYVPERREPRWRRTCRKCGRVEETRRVQEEVTKKPRW